MTGKEIFGLGHDVGELVGEIWSIIRHPVDSSVAETGLKEIKTFSATLEEGGKSRFLPALAIAVAAVSPDKDVEPRDAFDEFKSVLDERGRPLHRSDKPTSTVNTVKALYGEESDVPEYLENIDIEAHGGNNAEERIDTLSILANNEKSVLLMPFNRKLFNKTVELPKDIARIPLWGVAFGTYHPTDGRHKVRGADLSPMSVLCKVAFPVPPGLVGHEDQGTTDEVPMLEMMKTLSRSHIMAGNKNLSYVVSAQK